ncbi:hypothetical protein NEAUS03_0733 [Nematocida ausubeli]|nr:hypothetical protein NEAUS03_0733 [Nematocida ausubeli]
MTNSTGCIGLFRNGDIDKEVDLLDREPISMRTYLSLIIESFNKKSDFVLAIVIPAETAVKECADDNIPASTVGKGMVYLAECINLHRFHVSISNPNVIAVSRKNVVDPNVKCHIKTIYYYALGYSAFAEILNKKDKKLFKSLSRVQEDSPAAVAELAGMNPLILTCSWVGTEDDYLNNSVFHTYLEKNKILGYFFDAKKHCDRQVKKERVLVRGVLLAIGCFLICSLIIQSILHEFSYPTLLYHTTAMLFCGIVMLINERI